MDHDELVAFEMSTEYMIKPINTEKLIRFTQIEVSGKEQPSYNTSIDNSIHRIPVKNEKVQQVKANKNPGFFDQVGIKDLMDSIKIDKSTKLLDVLAEEFENKQLHKSHDKHGFQLITGLKVSQKTMASRFSKPDSVAGGFQRIANNIAPGVALMEPKDAKR